MKRFIALFLACVLIFSIFAFSGCKSEKEVVDNPVAVINVKNYGTITVELYYDKAPNTVKNFISLANKGFYDGLTFHRIISGFMIQGGCPDGNGTGDPGYSIAGEFDVNGFKNDLAHTRGVISMARGGYSYDSAGSQFFIVHQNSPHLNGQYAAFGKVVDGMKIVDEIAFVETDYNDKPLNDVIIESITVDTNGVYFDEPETLK